MLMARHEQVRWSNYIRVYGIHVLGWLIVTNLLKMHVYTYTRLLWGKLSGSARGRKEARKSMVICWYVVAGVINVQGASTGFGGLAMEQHIC